MLTLPDTDQPLDHAQSQGQGTLTLKVSLPMPWRRSDDRPQTDVVLDISYTYSPRGWCATTNGANTIRLDAPVALQPINIAKPWGQEIWFSGIEQRGESTVRQGDAALPLSHYLALAPQQLARRAAPILLKILDPKSQADAGNLYFETHDTKREVYVVTHIDKGAWPNGEGAIRLGMNQTLRKTYTSDTKFRAAYLASVQDYERIRRKLDTPATQPAAEHQQQQDQQQEVLLRQAMENFTASVPLKQGDVVQVAPGIPHSLQHGVRVFEFQTPTYERNIISFNQQVLTQDHWDSSYAIANMSLAGPQPPKLKTLQDGDGACVERIVDFDDFSVLRVTLEPQTSWRIDHPNSYAMLAIISGTATLHTQAGELQLHATTHDSSAAFLPASASNAQINTNKNSACLLLAIPKSTTAGTIPPSKTPIEPQ